MPAKEEKGNILLFHVSNSLYVSKSTLVLKVGVAYNISTLQFHSNNFNLKLLLKHFIILHGTIKPEV